MRSVVVLLAASLVGAGRSEGPEAPEITYQWKFLEMDGLGWRSALHRQLQPVARQESASVWTASRETASKLAESAARIAGTPRLTASSGVRCTVNHNTTKHFVAEMAREADGPVNHATFVGLVPRVENASEGYSAEVSGRMLDQGVLASLTFVDHRVTAIHTFPVSEDVTPKPGQAAKPARLQCDIQVPEYARTSVSGEWLIPKDGVLVVSLGVHTVADSKGKAVAREYLAVLEADEVEAQPVTAALGTAGLKLMSMSTSELGWDVRPATVPQPVPLSSPSLPSRSLPRPLDPAGKLVEMPPLPDDKTVTMLPGSSEPCASPQARSATASGEPVPWKKSQLRDTETNLTGFHEKGATPTDKAPAPEFLLNSMKRLYAAEADDKAPPCCDAGAYCSEDDSAVSQSKSSDTGKSIRFSIPLNSTFKIEVDARIKPMPSPSAP